MEKDVLKREQAGCLGTLPGVYMDRRGQWMLNTCRQVLPIGTMLCSVKPITSGDFLSAISPFFYFSRIDEVIT